ncbi:MAG TPA: hypothetical protein VKV26_13130 [Dehalococcoidia bacterium]|nr:hypothetical protein [Dehalococcoidia bacterium]
MTALSVDRPLEELLTRAPVIAGGMQRLAFPTAQIEIRERIAAALQEAGIIDVPLPFESFHERVRRGRVAPLQELVDPPTVQGNPAIREAYHRLVKLIARDLLQFDVVFEVNPFLRFHVPASLPLRYRAPDGKLLAHHNDILVGDPFEQINCWLPLTRCRGTAAFHISTLEQSTPLLLRFAAEQGLDATTFIGSRPRFYEMLATEQAFQDEVVGICRPLEIDYGELLVFDARVLHATTENFEAFTRISIDFRLVPLPLYEQGAARWRQSAAATAAGRPAPLRGSFYDERSAFEL